MKIDNIRVVAIESKSKILGVCSFRIQEAITFSGFTIVKGDKGLFISSPSYKGKDGKYHTYVFFNKKSIKEEIDKAILAEWAKISKEKAKETDGKKDEDFLDDDSDLPF